MKMCQQEVMAAVGEGGHVIRWLRLVFGVSHLFQQVVQEPHVGLLSLDGVGEKSVGLPGDQLLLRQPLHADDERRL